MKYVYRISYGGRVVYGTLTRAAALYRQHSKNVTVTIERAPVGEFEPYEYEPPITARNLR